MELLGHHAESVADELDASFSARAKYWLRCEAPWLLASLTGHAVVLLALLLVLGKFVAVKTADEEAPTFEAANAEPSPPAPPLLHFDPNPPLDPPPLDPDPPPANSEPTPLVGEPAGGAESDGESDGFLSGSPGEPQGRDTPFVVPKLGPGPMQKKLGTNGPTGRIGTACQLDSRTNKDLGKMTGMTPQSERAVARALYWLARHQLPDGSWSLREFDKRCTDKTCTGHGDAESDTGATALGLLPFLAAGHTHLSKGPYQTHVQKALYYLLSVQAKDGDLKSGSKGNSHMYAHALCAIALCEAYALSKDKSVRNAAQKSIDFIVAAQNGGTGGWRYEPGQEGDTSVVAWQVMALKSAQMAYLSVPQAALDGAEKWLKSCGHGNYGEQFSYQPGGGATPAMSAAGLLCSEYLHLKRDDPQLRGGVDYLLKHRPNVAERDTYYWYYATQVMHNLPGPEWDEWNRSIRKLLIETQATEGCAAGSWDPAHPTPDRWGSAGGRLLVTSLSCLTLEVYYRYLPLFQLDKGDRPNAALK